MSMASIGDVLASPRLWSRACLPYRDPPGLGPIGTETADARERQRRDGRMMMNEGGTKLRVKMAMAIRDAAGFAAGDGRAPPNF